MTAIISAPVAPAGAATSSSKDTLGTEFWMMFTKNYDSTPALSLFIAGPRATTGTVSVPGIAFSQDFTVTPGEVTTVELPTGAQASNAGAVEAKAIHVVAGDEVSVYGLNRISATTDAFNAIPVDALGTSYLILGYEVTITNLGSELGVAATADGTTVTITPTADLVDGKPAGTPFTVALNAGDTYSTMATALHADLSGSTVTADKPIAVYGGEQCTDIPYLDSACDYVVEQLPPIDAWGRAFVAEPLATRTKGDTFRILASEDATTVTINDQAQPVLNGGEFLEYRLDAPTPLAISSDKPVLVAQYSNSSTVDNVTSDPFMMLIPPFEQFLTSYTVTTPASGFAINYINVVAPSGAVGSILLDGTAIPAEDFAVIGDSGFSGAQEAVSLGAHNLSSTQPFGAFVYGFDSYDSYGYPGGSSFAPVARVTGIAFNVDTSVALIGTQACVLAKVTDQDGNGLAGIRVDFTLKGVNAQHDEGDLSSVTTDANGIASYCYTGTKEGTDHVTAKVGSLSATSMLQWVKYLRGYTLVSADGGFFAHGEQGFYGTLATAPFDAPSGRILNQSVVGGAFTPAQRGYWAVASDGGIFAFGDAEFYGSLGGQPLNKPIVGMAATPTGMGYWLVASDGGVFAFGDAQFLGSMGGTPLNKPIVGIASTPTGAGYWLAASDGGIFAFGDAGYHGSMGATPLNKPVVGIASNPTAQGYWLAASDGGIFTFGEAGYYGSMGATPLNKPIVGIASSGSGLGYMLGASDGGVFVFGDAPFVGSMAAAPLHEPIVAIIGA